MVQFHYLGTLGVGNTPIIYRPSIAITIQRYGRHITQMAIIDSGSDVTLMDFDIAQFLGIDLTGCREVNLGGITGSSVGYEAHVTVTIEQFDKEISLPVISTKELNTGILLGQIGFFENYKIMFDRAHKIFSLEANI